MILTLYQSAFWSGSSVCGRTDFLWLQNSGNGDCTRLFGSLKCFYFHIESASSNLLEPCLPLLSPLLTINFLVDGKRNVEHDQGQWCESFLAKARSEMRLQNLVWLHGHQSSPNVTGFIFSQKFKLTVCLYQLKIFSTASQSESTHVKCNNTRFLMLLLTVPGRLSLCVINVVCAFQNVWIYTHAN